MDFADQYIWMPLVVVLLVTVATLPTISWLILGPISQLAGRLKAPTRFQLSDFIWLLVMLQAVLGVCVQFVGLESGSLFGIVLGFLVFAVTALWAGAVSFLSHASITRPIRRAIFELVVLPLTLAFLFALPIVALAGTLEAIQYLHFLRVNRLALNGNDIAVGGLLTLATLLLFAAGGQILRWVSLWVAAPSNPAKPGTPVAGAGA